jgi:choline kinase
MGQITEKLPKPMVLLAGKPILQHQIKTAKQHQRDNNYQVVTTPRWNARGFCVSEVRNDSFIVNFTKAP